jgi:hypothetical protein
VDRTPSGVSPKETVRLRIIGDSLTVWASKFEGYRISLNWGWRDEESSFSQWIIGERGYAKMEQGSNDNARELVGIVIRNTRSEWRRRGAPEVPDEEKQRLELADFQSEISVKSRR